jgi:hypothetical protein
MITKQIIKSTFDVIQFIDDANGISESINDEPKVIEFKDHMKDIIEERTGIHWNRSYEQTVQGRIPKVTDPDVMKYIESIKGRGEEIRAQQIKEQEQSEKEEFKTTVIAFIGAFIFLFIMYKFLCFIF